MTRYQAAGGALGLALLIWWLWPGSARVKKELEIDANVNSPTFGLPLGSLPPLAPPATPTYNTEMLALIAESELRIAAHDAETLDEEAIQ